MSETDDAFQKLFDEYMRKFNDVPCSASEYRIQLRYVIEQLRTLIEASEEMDDDA